MATPDCLKPKALLQLHLRVQASSPDQPGAVFKKVGDYRFPPSSFDLQFCQATLSLSLTKLMMHVMRVLCCNLRVLCFKLRVFSYTCLLHFRTCAQSVSPDCGSQG